MEMKLGNFKLCKMSVEEYDANYSTDLEEEYGGTLDSIVWIEQYDELGEIVGMSEEAMLVFTDGTFAYTSRGRACDANLWTCLQVISSIEEL